MPLRTLHPTSTDEKAPVTPVAGLLRYDLPASIVVFLVAIPLSLGIAAASGAPIAAGLIAAAVGGIVAGLLGGSSVQVSGPAAGMVVLVAGFIGDYGWATVCAITIGAGLVQVILGALNAGRLARAIPPGVVHGMLAGIGITIALGQVRVLLGGHAASQPIDNLLGLPRSLASMSVPSALIGVGTIAVLLIWPKLPKAVRVIPGPLVAIGGATAVAALLHLDVARPELPRDILHLSFAPRLSGIGVSQFLSAALMMAALASIESLLSAVAVDKLHRGPRVQLRRELFGQGAANIACGALGGLPVTGVIVRSSTNAMAGGRSRASAVLHGVWVILFVALLAGVIEMIPTAALAGLLVHTGVKLVNVAHMRELAVHKDLALYVVTILGVLAIGLVEGVLIGIALSFILLPRRSNAHHIEVEQDGEVWNVRMRGTVGFLSVPTLLSGLAQVPPGSRARLDLDLDFLDHAALTVLWDWIEDHRGTGGTVLIDEGGQPWLTSASDGDPLVSKSSQALRESATPRWFEPRGDRSSGSSMTLAGIEDFHAHADSFRPALERLAEGQEPRTMVITCCDSRVLPHLLTASGPGDIFIARTIGNLVPEWSGGPLPDAGSSVAAAVDYAIGVLGVEEIVVCGHSACGAIAAAVNGVPEGEFAALEHWMESVPEELRRQADAVRAGTMSMDDLARLNVELQVEHLRKHPVVAARTARGDFRTLGIFFDIGQAHASVVSPSLELAGSTRA